MKVINLGVIEIANMAIRGRIKFAVPLQAFAGSRLAEATPSFGVPSGKLNSMPICVDSVKK